MSQQFVFATPTPTPPPVSGVIAHAQPSPLPIGLPLPREGQRRLLIGWSNFLRDVYGEALTTDPEAATALHAKHMQAMQAVERMQPRPLAAPIGALTSEEEAWVRKVTVTPGFLNVFGQRGWQFVRIPLEILVAWQPVIDRLPLARSARDPAGDDRTLRARGGGADQVLVHNHG
jgi:hypothetical protein